ncbi:MAG: selenide, water dikinase SelD [Gammaproteobacteria bacterium]|nr:selenide, water dikinase SelD [Gammaproteobacteria bacterium]
MKSNTAPVVKDLVLIGGGHSHIAVLKMFGMKPIPGVRITLITRDVHTPYSGMLPGYIAGHYSYDETHIDLRPLAIFAGARLFHSTAESIDFESREIHCPNRPPVKYDLLSINIGSRPAFNNIDGADEFTLPVKPIDNFLQGWEDIIARVHSSDQQFNLTVVGTGAGGVEMALATQYRLQQVLKEQNRDINALKVTLIGSDHEILKTHNAQVRKKFMRVLGERNIHLISGKPVTRVTRDQVICGETVVDSDATIWVTNAWAQAWPNDSGLSTDESGFIKVNDCLQSIDHDEVFAVGDIAAVVNHPREKSGVFAVRQGPPLAENLRRVLLGRQPKSFIPQKNFLGLISTGNQYAIASRGSWSMEGEWLWKIKDWIDRRFMENFSELPEMQPEEDPAFDIQLADNEAMQELSAIAMRCGGCGAKVGSTILSRVVNRLETLNRNDVVIGLDSPDDAAVLSVPPGKVMVQSVDYFRAFIDDAYVFGQIAANHALGDVFAMGADAQSALAIATLPHGREAIVEDQLFQLMSGALSILNESGTALVGGHSSEGAELAFGLTVNGIADPEKMLRKGGMRPGQAIILTKPIGTGTLLAADMRSKAKGRWVHGAIDSMVVSNQSGADILIQHGATACTDVTGFGLLGHLVEMTRASAVDVELDTESVPLLDGAIECIENGIFSSLQPQNVRLRRAIRDNGYNRESPRYALLFDPQTAGGLLASLPEEKASACVTALQHAGYTDTAIIGRVKAQGEEAESINLI